MLEQFREFASRKFVRYVFALFLIIPFGLFGIDYYFQTPIGGDAVASVGSMRISQSEYDRALREQADTYRQQFGAGFDPAIMESAEIRRAVLDRLISERLLIVGSQRSGTRIGDGQLAERILEEPAFQVDGKFSRERYEQIAKSQGLTPVGLDERLREEMRTARFRSAIVDTAIVPRTTLDSFIRLSEQTREVSVIPFAPELYLSRVQAGPEQVQAYYDAHKAEFTVPEQVRVEYVELSVDALAAQAKVDPEEVRALWQKDIAPKYEERQAARRKMEEIVAELRKPGAKFDELARKHSQDAGTAPAGGDLGFFGRGTMVKPFEDAAFALKPGQTSGIVESEFGFHVIRLEEVKAGGGPGAEQRRARHILVNAPKEGKSLEAARPEIEARLRKEPAQRRFSEIAEQFANIVYEQPSSLKPAADALKLNVQQSGWFAKGPGAPPMLSNPKLLAEIFSDEAIKGQRNTQAIEVAPGVLVSARIAEHRASELKPLEAVRVEVERRLKREEALKLAQADGEAKLKALQSGGDAGLKWPAPLAVNRQKPGGLFPQVIDRVFRVDPKKLPAYVGVSTPAGYSLVQVSRVIDVEKIDEAKRDALAGQLRAAVAVQQLEASLAGVRERVGVSVRKGALEKKPDA